jgi:hypothetical protein
MARQYAAPGAGVVDETGSRQYVAPGLGAVDETVLAARSATLSASIGTLTLSAAAQAVDVATVAQTIGPVTLSAALAAIDSASFAAPLGEISLAATAVAVPVVLHGSPAVPWWWRQYIARHEAERAAERRKWLIDHTVEGDGVGVMPTPFGHGEATHAKPALDTEDDVAAIAAATLWLLAA